MIGAAAENLIKQRVNIELFSATTLTLMDSGTAITRIAEDSLVIEAFRRSDNQLTNASVAEISEYFSEYSLEAQQGIISNVKGIYHELAFVDHKNTDDDLWFAELMPRILDRSIKLLSVFMSGNKIVLSNSSKYPSYCPAVRTWKLICI